MSYGFDSQGALAVQIIDIAGEQLRAAVSETSAAGDLRERVHSVRTCLKKTRSLLRLIRHSLPPEVYETENSRIRDLGRRLAPLRDAFVQLTAFDAAAMPPDNPAARRAREVLAQNDDQQFKAAPAALEAIRPLLADALSAVEKWPVSSFQASDLCRGMHDVYRTARKAFAKAKQKPSPEMLHRWRGKTKALGHVLRLSDQFLSKALKQESKWARDLGDLLGDYHDLAVLMGTLDQLPKPLKNRKPLLRMLARRSSCLQKRAFRCGAKIFHRKPAAWTRKLARRVPSI